MPQLDPLAALSSISCLRPLSPSTLEEMATATRLRSFQPREQLWAAGDPIPGIFFPLSGLVRVYHDENPAQSTPVVTTWPGEIIVMNSQTHHEWTTYGVAVTSVTQVTVPFQAFADACRQNASQTHQVLNALVSDYSRRISWETDLRLVPLTQRLLLLFARMAAELGTPTAAGILLDFPLTCEIVAALTWVKRDHTGRMLNDLVHEGYLVKQPRFRWLIPDCKRLGELPLYLTERH